MQLFAWHAHFLHDILFLDPRAENVRLVQLDELFGLVVRNVINHQRPFGHLHHHAFVILEAQARIGQFLDLFG